MDLKKTEEHNYKTINEGGFSFFSTQEKEDEKPVYKVGGNAEINALIIGIGVSVSFENKKSENTNIINNKISVKRQGKKN